MPYIRPGTFGPHSPPRTRHMNRSWRWRRSCLLQCTRTSTCNDCYNRVV